MVASKSSYPLRPRATIIPPPGPGSTIRTRRTEPPLVMVDATETLMRAEDLVKTALRIISRADELYHSAAAMGAGNASLSHYRLVRGGVR